MQRFTRAAFYFVAHADDWQLFMTPEISGDISDKRCKLVIVHITAGDAGKDEKYWQARERAAFDSLLFRLSVDDQVEQRESYIDFGNNKAYIRSANNCVCYFLRVPDGAYDGSGFKKYNHQSLNNLHNGTIDLLSSLDGKSSYKSWSELSEMIDLIINREIIDSSDDVCLNFPEYDPILNLNDHNDHYLTSKLIQTTEAYCKYVKRTFISYHIIDKNDFLTDEELFWKIGMFSVYHQSLFREYGHSTISEDKSFIPWCLRKSSYRYL
jgi:hypothetical protein